MPAKRMRSPQGPASAGVASGWRKNWRREKRDHKARVKHSKGVGQNSGKPAKISFECGGKRGTPPKTHKNFGYQPC